MKKKNNKGFSLVELIVVIAIMAVLVGVLAPQYIRYVEKTRLQKDNSAIAEVAEAMKMAISDENVMNSLTFNGTDNKITFSNTTATAGATKTFDTSNKLEAEVAATIGSSYTTSSNTYKKSTTDITLTVGSDGKVTCTGIITTANATSADSTQPTY